MPLDTWARRTQYRDTVANWIASLEFKYFVTLCTELSDYSPSHMRTLLKRFDARLNRKLLGRRWQAKPAQRLVWAAFLERPYGNPHWHLVLKRPRDDSPLSDVRFTWTARGVWSEVCPRGSFDCRLIENERASTYVTKCLRDPNLMESIVIYSEFWSTSQSLGRPSS